MLDLTDERWLPVVGSEGRYEVSDTGRVRAIFVPRNHPNVPTPRILGGIHKSTGYPRVELSSPSRSVHVHRLVLEAFVGPAPTGMECRHLDGGRANNVLSNLCWGTKTENREDMRRHGTDFNGARNGRAKLTNEQVREIRQLFARGLGLTQIGHRYGVTGENVFFIVRHLTWTHVA